MCNENNLIVVSCHVVFQHSILLHVELWTGHTCLWHNFWFRTGSFGIIRNTVCQSVSNVGYSIKYCLLLPISSRFLSVPVIALRSSGWRTFRLVHRAMIITLYYFLTFWFIVSHLLQDNT